MPTYEYSCPKCGTFDYVQKITEDRLAACPTCSSPVERLVSGGTFHLKGSGWYKTDYAGGSSGSSSSSTSQTNSSSSSSGGVSDGGSASDVSKAPATSTESSSSTTAKSE